MMLSQREVLPNDPAERARSRDEGTCLHMMGQIMNNFYQEQLVSGQKPKSHFKHEDTSMSVKVEEKTIVMDYVILGNEMAFIVLDKDTLQVVQEESHLDLYKIHDTRTYDSDEVIADRMTQSLIKFCNKVKPQPV